MMFVRLGIVNAFLEFVGALAVKDLVLSLLWLGSLLWCRFDPWPGNFCMQRAQPKKKKKLKNAFLTYFQLVMCLSGCNSIVSQKRSADIFNRGQGDTSRRHLSLKGIAFKYEYNTA